MTLQATEPPCQGLSLNFLFTFLQKEKFLLHLSKFCVVSNIKVLIAETGNPHIATNCMEYYHGGFVVSYGTLSASLRCNRYVYMLK